MPVATGRKVCFQGQRKTLVNAEKIQSVRAARLGLALFAICLAAAGSHAADWRQYNGPNGDRRTTETIGPIDWSQGAPTPIWKIPTTNGFSSFTVADGKAFTLVSREDASSVMREYCVGLDASTGRELWAAPLGEAKYDGGGGAGDGPRSTPSCDGERVYVYDATMNLYCLNESNGSPIWKKDIVADYGGRNIEWQSASSPLLEGELVVASGGGPGQSLLAFDRADGHVVWQSLDEIMSHATPVAATIQGVRQIVFFLHSGLVAVSVADGAELWRYAVGPFNISYAASPVIHGDYVYCSAAYGVGARLVHVVKNGTQLRAVEVWSKPGALMNQWNTPVYYNGYLYGLYGWSDYGDAPLKCVEFATGDEVWSQDEFGEGNLILVGDKLVVLTDYGEMAIVEATPAAYTEVARATILNNETWSTPILSDNRIYARSNTEGVCFELSAKTRVKQSQDYE